MKLSEVIGDVLEAEKEALAAVNRAREEAKERERVAEIQAQNMINRADEESRELIKDRIAEAQARHAQEKEQSLAKAKADLETFVLSRQEEIRRAADDVAALIARPVFTREGA